MERHQCKKNFWCKKLAVDQNISQPNQAKWGIIGPASTDIWNSTRFLGFPNISHPFYQQLHHGQYNRELLPFGFWLSCQNPIALRTAPDTSNITATHFQVSWSQGSIKPLWCLQCLFIISTGSRLAWDYRRLAWGSWEGLQAGIWMEHRLWHSQSVLVMQKRCWSCHWCPWTLSQTWGMSGKLWPPRRVGGLCVLHHIKDSWKVPQVHKSHGNDPILLHSVNWHSQRLVCRVLWASTTFLQKPKPEK